MAQRVERERANVQEDIVADQRLRAALHLAVGELGRSLSSSLGVTFDNSVTAAIAQLAFTHAEQVAQDAEAFARHAKRASVQTEDICLCARRNSDLHDHLTELKTSLSASASANAAGRKRKTAGKATASAAKKGKQSEPEKPLDFDVDDETN